MTAIVRTVAQRHAVTMPIVEMGFFFLMIGAFMLTA